MHGLLCPNTTQRHTVVPECHCPVCIAWLGRNVLFHYRNMEHYVVTWKNSCPETLGRDIRYTLSRHNFKQLCRGIKTLSKAKLCRDIETPGLDQTLLRLEILYRDKETLAKAKPVAIQRMQHLTFCRGLLGRNMETSITTLSQ